MRMQIMTCRIGDEPPALVYVAEGTINNTGHTLPPCASGKFVFDEASDTQTILPVMNRLFRTSSRPRSLAGAVSARYTGTLIDARPSGQIARGSKG